MPDIKKALSECKELIEHLFEVLKLDYEIITDEDVEEPNVYLETPGVGITLGVVEEKQHPAFEETYQRIEYGVYVVHYIPGTWHQPPDCDVEDVLTTPHMGEAVKALVLQIVDSIIELEFESMSDEELAKIDAEAEAMIEANREFQEQRSIEWAIREGLLEEERQREMLCGEDQDVH